MKKFVVFIIISLFLPPYISLDAKEPKKKIVLEAEELREGPPVIDIKETHKTPGLKTELRVKDVPVGHKRKGIHFKRKYRLTLYGSDVNHRLPFQYLNAVPAGEERHGLSEHLMIGLYSNFRSLYMSREYPCSKGPVWQPSAAIEAYGIGFNVWANFVLNNEANQGQFNEVDLTLYYTGHIGDFTFHPYVLTFLMPNGDPASLDYSPHPATVEIDLFLEYKIWQFTIYSLTRTGVYASTGQVYSHIGLSFTQPIGPTLGLHPSVHMSFGNDKFLASHTGQRVGTSVDAIAGELALPWNPWRGLTFTPNIQFAVHMTPEVRRAIRQNPNLSTYNVWGGVDVAYNF